MRDTALKRGFTLIELLITVALIAILLAIGIPSFRNLIQNSRATSIANDLLLAVQLTRSEAVKQRIEMTLCRRNTAGDNCANGTDWSAGWLIRVTDGAIVQAWDPPGGSPVLTGPSAGIDFARTGEPTLAPPANTFTLQLPNCTGDERRTLTVNAAGFVNIARSACP